MFIKELSSKHWINYTIFFRVYLSNCEFDNARRVWKYRRKPPATRWGQNIRQMALQRGIVSRPLTNRPFLETNGHTADYGFILYSYCHSKFNDKYTHTIFPGRC